jgi:hypothetical protein
MVRSRCRPSWGVGARQLPHGSPDRLGHGQPRVPPARRVAPWPPSPSPPTDCSASASISARARPARPPARRGSPPRRWDPPGEPGFAPRQRPGGGALDRSDQRQRLKLLTPGAAAGGPGNAAPCCPGRGRPAVEQHRPVLPLADQARLDRHRRRRVRHGHLLRPTRRRGGGNRAARCRGRPHGGTPSSSNQRRRESARGCRVPWNFGGGPIMVRLRCCRLPCHPRS